FACTGLAGEYGLSYMTCSVGEGECESGIAPSRDVTFPCLISHRVGRRQVFTRSAYAPQAERSRGESLYSPSSLLGLGLRELRCPIVWFTLGPDSRVVRIAVLSGPRRVSSRGALREAEQGCRSAPIRRAWPRGRRRPC